MIMESSPVPSSPRLLPFLFFEESSVFSDHRGARGPAGDRGTPPPASRGRVGVITKQPRCHPVLTSSRARGGRGAGGGRQAGRQDGGQWAASTLPWARGALGLRPRWARQVEKWLCMGECGRPRLLRATPFLLRYPVLTSSRPGTRRPCSYRCSTSRSRSSSPPPPRACRVSPCTHAGTGQRPASFPALMKLPQTVRRP